VSFSRHRKIYQSDGLEGKLNWPSNLPTDHRSDESSTGYSFTGCHHSPSQHLQEPEHEYALSILDPSSFEKRPQLTRPSLPPFACREGGVLLHCNSQPAPLWKHFGRAWA
jgi:hypothetical protein